MTQPNLAVIRTASTVLPRELLPGNNEGLFTPSDNAPKSGETTGQHTVRRTIRGIRVLKSGPVGYMPRKGEIYAVQFDGESGKWLATERLVGKKLEAANSTIGREKATAQAEVKAAKAAAKPKAKMKAKAKVKASKS